jgi:hypothetical protein
VASGRRTCRGSVADGTRFLWFSKVAAARPVLSLEHPLSWSPGVSAKLAGLRGAFCRRRCLISELRERDLRQGRFGKDMRAAE